MPLFEYQCACGQVTEALRSFTVSSLQCPLCGGLAVKRPSLFRQISPSDSIERRQGYSRFREASAEIDHAFSRAEAIERPGSIQSPNLWAAAKARAAAIAAAGETPAIPPQG